MSAFSSGKKDDWKWTVMIMNQLTGGKSERTYQLVQFLHAGTSPCSLDPLQQCHRLSSRQSFHHFTIHPFLSERTGDFSQTLAYSKLPRQLIPLESSIGLLCNEV